MTHVNDLILQLYLNRVAERQSQRKKNKELPPFETIKVHSAAANYLSDHNYIYKTKEKRYVI